MDVLVTGGTGFLGPHLITAIQARGHTVRALVLPSEDTACLEEYGLAIDRGGVRQVESLQPALSGVDRAFHLASPGPGWQHPREHYAANVLGTTNVCQAAPAARARRLVHVSAEMVYWRGFKGPVRAAPR